MSPYPLTIMWHEKSDVCALWVTKSFGTTEDAVGLHVASLMARGISRVTVTRNA